MIDTHSHLFAEEFKDDLEDCILRCKENNVKKIMLVGFSDETNLKAQELSKKYDQKVISLIAPTSENRIKKIAENAEGVIYLVSSLGVTGVRSEFNKNLENIVKEIKKYTDIPVAIGFGISNPEAVKNMCKISDGAIVGSAIVRIVEEHLEDSSQYIYDFCKSMVEATK